MSDTLMRQWQMLRRVPRHPVKISTAELKQHLADEGFDTTQRTIQRDLMTLSDIYPLTCDDSSKPFGWSWMRDADVMDIPGMDSHTALTFYLAGKYLEPLLPIATVNHLNPHFKTAAHVLDGINSRKGAPGWADKVRVVHRGPPLKSPAVREEVQDNVYDALLHNRQLHVRYNPRWEEGSREYEVNPLGLVLKEGVFYLVCSFWDYQDIRLLTLHRMLEAKVLDAPCMVPDGFDLDGYIASGELAFTVSGTIKLEALFSKGAAFHLDERPLADDQAIIKQEDGRMLVTATVQDTSELRWWLLGFGGGVEIVAPKSLRREFQSIATLMLKQYSEYP